MRYFKYYDTSKTEKAALKKQYAELTKEEQRIARKEKTQRIIGISVFAIVAAVCFVASLLVILEIPEPKNLFLNILINIGKSLITLIAVIISLIIGALAASPIFKIADSKHKTMKKQILSEACLHLREYYKLGEPCIVTKCYESSDKKFTNHDVCIFVVEDELRITVNLLHGFFNGENDLGCYVFKRDEISVTKKQGEKLLIAELKAGDMVFLLGYRAKRFIENNFISDKMPS